VGPIKDQSGMVRFKDGQELTFEDFVTWDWFVEGVQGKLPG
jgi:basic membrane protein A and related proteins